jgi:hypothetical protein
MEGHYISFTHSNEPEHELLRVYPSELRRQYVPTPGEGTQEISGIQCTVMRMEYTNSDCIVRLGCSEGVPVMFDAVLVILKTYYPLEDIEATFHPANIKLELSSHRLNDSTENIKKMVEYFFPNILVTNKYGKDDLIEISTKF